MKKIILSLAVFLMMFLYKPSLSFAGCVILTTANPNACNLPKITCNVSAMEIFCCNTQHECDVQKEVDSNPSCDGLDASSGISTAIGCIPVNNPNQFVGWILGWAIGIGGGIAFLLIIYASFMVMTSQGIPERLNGGKELLTSAISGLILLIFSVFILRFIGIDILGLGLFGFGQ